MPTVTTEEFVRRAISKKILERKFGDRGRRYVGRIIRRARRSLLRALVKEEQPDA